MKSAKFWTYPVAVLIVFITWSSAMFAFDLWHLFKEYWSMSLTMVLGSFVAGSTPAGGAAVAFPVFTKVLNISTHEARTFGLMIQSVGMTMASIFIISRGIPFFKNIVLWSGIAGVAGVLFGSVCIDLPGAYGRIIFSIVSAVFGLTYSLYHFYFQLESDHREFRIQSRRRRLHFVFIGFIGGIFSSVTGSGVDLLTFIVMVIAYRLDPSKSVPTTVLVMSMTSIAGFMCRLLVIGDVGIEFGYWMVCVPIVAVGAPLGAWVASFIKKDVLISGLLVLITMDVTSTLLIVPMDLSRYSLLSGAVIFSAVWIYLLMKVGDRNYESSLSTTVDNG